MCYTYWCLCSSPLQTIVYNYNSLTLTLCVTYNNSPILLRPVHTGKKPNQFGTGFKLVSPKPVSNRLRSTFVAFTLATLPFEIQIKIKVLPRNVMWLPCVTVAITPKNDCWSGVGTADPGIARLRQCIVTRRKGKKYISLQITEGER